jgi:transposase InsO family protein
MVSGSRGSCRGRLLRLRALRARSAAECTDRSVPLGRYWRGSPLVCSFDPRCQGLCGSQIRQRAARADLIRRDVAVNAAAVNTRWCGDITYIPTWEGWL